MPSLNKPKQGGKPRREYTKGDYIFTNDVNEQKKP